MENRKFCELNDHENTQRKPEKMYTLTCLFEKMNEEPNAQAYQLIHIRSLQKSTSSSPKYRRQEMAKKGLPIESKQTDDSGITKANL